MRQRIREMSCIGLLWLVAISGLPSCSSGDEDIPMFTDTDGRQGDSIEVQFSFRVQDLLSPVQFQTVFESNGQNSLSTSLSQLEYQPYSVVAQSYYPRTGRLVDSQIFATACHLIEGERAPIVKEVQSVRVLPSGQLVGGDVRCEYEDGSSVIADLRRLNICDPLLPCSTEQSCGLILAHTDPELLHIKCSPIGVVNVGDACVFEEPSPLNHDNCVAGAGCIDGICRSFCELSGSRCVVGTSCILPEVLEWASQGVCAAI